MTTTYGGYIGAILAFIREQGPLLPGRHSVTSQCAQAAGVTIHRARQILDQLATDGAIQVERADTGWRPITKAETP